MNESSITYLPLNVFGMSEIMLKVCKSIMTETLLWVCKNERKDIYCSLSFTPVIESIRFTSRKYYLYNFQHFS